MDIGGVPLDIFSSLSHRLWRKYLIRLQPTKLLPIFPSNFSFSREPNKGHKENGENNLGQHLEKKRGKTGEDCSLYD